MDWSFLLSLLLTVLVFVGVQIFLVRRRIRARMIQQLELLARAEIEKRLRERLINQIGVAASADPAAKDN